jgi:D-glycero-D-manno-heptose 1,7-bisphosphate phosphatase
MKRPAAFIDRDGVINIERGYVHKAADFEWVPGVFDGLRRLQSAGFALIVVTNQAGIAKGYYAESDFDRLTAHMLKQLNGEGIQIEKVYHCPHHPRATRADLRRNCDCRKPAPGMLLQAASDLGLDLALSVLVGDKASDVEAGRAAGVARCVLVRSGHTVSLAAQALADACVDDLAAAAIWLTGPGDGMARNADNNHHTAWPEDRHPIYFEPDSLKT